MSRKEAELELLHFIDRIDPGSPNRDIYKKRLSEMNDEQFEQFIEDLDSGAKKLYFFKPNLIGQPITQKHLLQIGDELGHSFFEYVWLTDKETGQVVRSRDKHLILLTFVRRQAQMLYEKMSVPEHNRSVDERTGQPAGASASARISWPELHVNAGKGGLDNMILELIKFRGGDTRAFNRMNKAITETGEAPLEHIAATERTNVQSLETVSTYLKAMHLQNEL